MTQLRWMPSLSFWGIIGCMVEEVIIQCHILLRGRPVEWAWAVVVFVVAVTYSRGKIVVVRCCSRLAGQRHSPSYRARIALAHHLEQNTLYPYFEADSQCKKQICPTTSHTSMQC